MDDKNFWQPPLFFWLEHPSCLDFQATCFFSIPQQTYCNKKFASLKNYVNVHELQLKRSLRHYYKLNFSFQWQDGLNWHMFYMYKFEFLLLGRAGVTFTCTYRDYQSHTPSNDFPISKTVLVDVNQMYPNNNIELSFRNLYFNVNSQSTRVALSSLLDSSLNRTQKWDL